MVTAVSPNVVVDILLRLRDENLGLYKGIHTIIITVTICSDVLSIFLFGLVLGMIFSTGKYPSLFYSNPIRPQLYCQKYIHSHHRLIERSIAPRTGGHYHWHCLWYRKWGSRLYSAI